MDTTIVGEIKGLSFQDWSSHFHPSNEFWW